MAGEVATIPGRGPFHRRRKVCPFSGDKAPKIDYKDAAFSAALCRSVARSCQAASRRCVPKNSASLLKRLSGRGSSRFCPT